MIHKAKVSMKAVFSCKKSYFASDLIFLATSHVPNGSKDNPMIKWCIGMIVCLFFNLLLEINVSTLKDFFSHTLLLKQFKK